MTIAISLQATLSNLNKCAIKFASCFTSTNASARVKGLGKSLECKHKYIEHATRFQDKVMNMLINKKF